MRTELLARAGLRRSATLTDAILTGWINSGIAEVHDLIARHNPDFLLKWKDVEAYADDATVTLPTDFYQLRRLDLVEGDVSTRLRPFQIDDELYLGEGEVWDPGRLGTRLRYMLQAGCVRLVPTPESTIVLRLWYVPHATKLSADGDKYNGVNGHEDLVYEHALRLMKARESRDTSMHDQAIARLTKRLLAALGARNQSEPEYLADHSRGGF